MKVGTFQPTSPKQTSKQTVPNNIEHRHTRIPRPFQRTSIWVPLAHWTRRGNRARASIPPAVKNPLRLLSILSPEHQQRRQGRNATSELLFTAQHRNPRPFSHLRVSPGRLDHLHCICIRICICISDCTALLCFRQRRESVGVPSPPHAACRPFVHARLSSSPLLSAAPYSLKDEPDTRRATRHKGEAPGPAWIEGETRK